MSQNSSPQSTTQPIIFISYSREDDEEKDQLLSHLLVLQKQGLVRCWSDDQIGAGANWKQEIAEAMAHAKVAILLISTNFLTSDFIVNEEVPALLKRRESEGLIVFPVIAKACAWQEVKWLADINVKPRGGRPIWSTENPHVDEDLAKIVKEVAAIVKKKSSPIPIGGGVGGKSQRTKEEAVQGKKLPPTPPKELSVKEFLKLLFDLRHYSTRRWKGVAIVTLIVIIVIAFLTYKGNSDPVTPNQVAPSAEFIPIAIKISTTPTPTVTPTNTTVSPSPTPVSTSTPTPTATPVPATSTPTATTTPTNTPTMPSPSVTPTELPSPTATATSTVPPSPTVMAASTASPSPTATVASTPPTEMFTLLKPILGELISGPTVFEWQWNSQLEPGQGFEVRVWREGEKPAGVHNAVEDNQMGKVVLENNTYRLSIGDIGSAPGVNKRSGEYLWTVVLVKVSPKYEDLQIQASPGRLCFEACGGNGGDGRSGKTTVQ